MWEPVVCSFRRWHGSWKGQYLSLGGRITLINSVLLSLPLYFFSFYRASKRIIATLVSIQRRFLWFGMLDLDKICWVDWNSVCRAKADGGLGVKIIATFNASMLAKWRWRFLVENDALCCGFLAHGYGCLDRFREHQARSGSAWWQDLMRIDVGVDWFSSRVVCWIGDGQDTSFMEDSWYGESCLKDIFPHLFYLMIDQEVNVGEMSVEASDHGMAWSWRW